MPADTRPSAVQPRRAPCGEDAPARTSNDTTLPAELKRVSPQGMKTI
jgi:hypothetical protein